MDQVFSLNNKTLKNTGKMGKKIGNVREFCESGKVGTMAHAKLAQKSVGLGTRGAGAQYSQG